MPSICAEDVAVARRCFPAAQGPERRCSLTSPDSEATRRVSPTDEPRMTPKRREIRNRELRATVAGNAEITLERMQHLNLARERDALDLPMRIDGEAVARLAEARALTNKTAADFALADLRT